MWKLLTIAEAVATSGPVRTIRRRFGERVAVEIHPLPQALGVPGTVEFEVLASLRGKLIGRSALGPLWRHLGISLPFSGGTHVLRRFRGIGAGRALLVAAIDEARKRGLEEVWANISVDNVRSAALCESVGFRRVHEPRILGVLQEGCEAVDAHAKRQELWLCSTRQSAR